MIGSNGKTLLLEGILSFSITIRLQLFEAKKKKIAYKLVQGRKEMLIKPPPPQGK